MSTYSAIEWTDRTWNPVVGCTVVSPGCAHCYAKTLHDRRHKAYRSGKLQHFPQYAKPFETVQLLPQRLTDPLHWRKPGRVFVNSLSDMFHENVPDEFIDQVFAVMALADRQTFQILTKRPERMLAYFADEFRWALIEGAAQRIYFERTGDDPSLWLAVHGPLPNVWLGVSVENQRHSWRASVLGEVPAAVRFLSCEPLLGWLYLEECLVRDEPLEHPSVQSRHNMLAPFGGVDWVIVGGESGPDWRPMHYGWAQKIVYDCQNANVPVFVKQLGGHPDKHGDPSAWPEALRVREFPAAKVPA